MDERNCSGRMSFPSVHDLLDTEFDDENLNIDDGLSAREDDSLFMMASMVFLQRQLKKKLGLSEDANGKSKPGRVYSDMLLFKNRSGEHGERFFIRLKDSEKFHNIRKSETVIPDTAIAHHQLLPLAKNPRLKLSRFFKSMSKHFLKHNHTDLAHSSTITTSVECPLNSNNSTVENEDIGGYEPQGTSSESYGVDWINKVKIKCSQNKPDIDLLRSLSSMTKVSLKTSITENLRSRPSGVSVSANPENTLYDTETEMVTPIQIPKRSSKLTKQLSKLSVCVEDDTDESENELSRELSSRISCNNLPDEVKTNLTPEVLQEIVSQMIVYFEDSSKNNET